MKEQHDNKDEPSSGPLADLLVQVCPLQECNEKMFFLKHQQKFAPVEEKHPNMDLVLVSSSSISPSISLLVPMDRHGAPWWSAGSCQRSK